MIKYYIEGLTIQNQETGEKKDVFEIGYKQVSEKGRHSDEIKVQRPVYNGELLHGEWMPLLISVDKAGRETIEYIFTEFDIECDFNKIVSEGFDYENLPFGVVQSLIDLSIDVFGLIKKGGALAVKPPSKVKEIT